MMRWMNLTIIYLSLVLLLLTSPLSVNDSFAKSGPTIQSLILYSNLDQPPDENVYLLDQLVSHFSTTEIKPASEVANLDQYDYIFYLGLEAEKIEHSTINAINAFSQPVIFIGYNASQFEVGRNLDVSTNQVSIKEISLEEDRSKSTFASLKKVHQITVDQRNILIEGWRGNYSYPLFVSVGQNYYLATDELDELLVHYLARILPSLFKINVEKAKLAFIKMEDVHPATNIEAFRQLTSYLTTEKIPIILAISPVYEDPNTNKLRHFSESPELVRKLLSLQKLGADFVYSYPAFSEDITITDKKIMIEKEIQELASYRIYPIAVSFSTNLYKVSQDDLQIAASYFSTLLSDAKAGNTAMLTQTSPFIAKPSYLNGLVWFPETLGSINLQDPISFRKMKYEMNQLKNVSGATLGLTFHSYMSLELLNNIVTELKAISNKRWINLKDWNHSVEVPYVNIQSSNDGIISIQNEIPFYIKFMYKHQLTTFEIALWLLSFVVTVFVVIFSVYSFYLKTKLRKNLFSERKSHGQ